MKSFLKSAIFGVILLITAMAVSPYYQLYRFKTAHEQGDYTPIISSIDYDSFRPSVKRELLGKLDNIKHHQVMTLLPLLGGSPDKMETFAVNFIDGAVDRAITPDNLTELSRGNITKDSEPLLMGLMLWLGADLLNLGTLMQDYLATGDIQTAIARQEKLIRKNAKHLTIKPSTPDVGYCGINCFFIKTDIKNQTITIKMSRHKLITWQIDDITLS